MTTPLEKPKVCPIKDKNGNIIKDPPKEPFQPPKKYKEWKIEIDMLNNTPREILKEICEILQIEYENKDACHSKIINNIEELLMFKTDFMKEQDWKEKYENLKEELQDTLNAIFLDCINNFSNCLIPRIMTLHKDDFLEFIIKNMDNIVLQGDGKDPKWIGSSEGGYFWRIYKDGMIETNIKYMTSELLHELAKNIEKLESFLDIEENI